MSNRTEKKDGRHSYNQHFEFDTNQVDRILNLLTLKSRCLRLETATRLELGCSDPAMSFFWGVALATDSLLLSQINDEVAECFNDRGPTRALIGAVIDAARTKGVDVPQAAIDDFPALFCDRAEFNRGSVFLDFVVGSYSVFEMFMGRIYEQLRPRYPRSGKQAKSIAALISEYNTTSPEAREEILDRIIKAGGDYVSGRDKINFVMSKLSKEYSRDLAQDRAIIDFYANGRNTIHNLGRNTSSKDFMASIGDAEITLRPGKPMFSADRSHIIRLCGELVEIYLNVLMVNANLGKETFFVTK